MLTTHRLFAFGRDGTMYVHPVKFTPGNAVDAWYNHDNDRLDGKRPHVAWYAVREDGHEYSEGAVESTVPFLNAPPGGETILTDSECTVIMDSLARTRDALKAEGRATPNIESALAKIQHGYAPSTAGILFRHFTR